MISSSSQDSSFKGIVFYKFLFSFICLRSHSSVFVVDLFDCPENIIIGKLLSRLGCRVITYIQFFFFFFQSTRYVGDKVRKFAFFNPLFPLMVLWFDVVV